MKVTNYFLGRMCTTTAINSESRNRFTTVAKFGPLDPIVTFFHSHDVIYLCHCYFRVQGRLVWLNYKCGENYFHGKESKKICV